ncbi:UDP-N-acetylglucosamine 2-epimerase [Halioglobus japonicus]|nr:UDP-N-acetylglucosamine 2-epimerase [Halioglobus japonicus]
MIHVFVGTKAQLIKMAPIMIELQRRNIRYNFIFSGQHQATVKNIRDEFAVKDPDITLYHGKDITGILQMFFWGVRILFFTLWNRRKVWQGDKNGIVLNHGDTFSTLLGSLLARVCGQRSAHVESGLRSFNLFHPFPEEVTRLLTFQLTNIYFAPGDWALNNLRKYRGIKVDTLQNTLLDALRISESAVEIADVEIPGYPYAVVSLHRFENIFSKEKLTEIVDLLLQVSKKTKLLFILHKPTEKKLEQHRLRAKLEACSNIEMRPRYSYFQFIKLIKNASLVITDGGSNQEECFYLGKPCIIMRTTSERREGLGENAVICNYQYAEIERVIDNLAKYKIVADQSTVSPTNIIIDELTRLDG